MNSLLHAITHRIEVTPGRVSALGAAVGGLFALMVVNLFGAPSAEAAAVLPTATGVSAAKAIGLFILLAQIAGALIGWKSASRRISDRA